MSMKVIKPTAMIPQSDSLRDAGVSASSLCTLADLANGLQEFAKATIEIHPVDSASVSSPGAGGIQVNWVDTTNPAKTIESYAIYLWSSNEQDGRWFYFQNDGSPFEYIFARLPAGSYDLKIEAEGYYKNGSTPVVPTGAPIVIT